MPSGGDSSWMTDSSLILGILKLDSAIHAAILVQLVWWLMLEHQKTEARAQQGSAKF